jgi:creatinine amidohydrolase
MRFGDLTFQEIRERASDSESTPVDWDDPHLDFARYSSTGVIGDPTHASAELGVRLWHAVVKDVALTLKEISEEEIQ